ncbi:MAG TPA: DUF3800 domain-containing protein [Allosphingosinicella sp.]|jgi:hypothetical protein
MLFAYMDESKERNSFFVYSVLVVNADRWPVVFRKVKDFRKQLRERHGIYLAQELHASAFAAGKGQISDRVLDKPARADIFREVLTFVATAKEFAIMSSVNVSQERAFERLMNRINRTAEAKGKHKVLLICDEGEERQVTKEIRRMRIHNPIPSNRGRWFGTADATKNIPLSQFIEDPVFKDSKQSYFIQLVDFCAYALLRSERPLPARTTLGHDRMYEILRPICQTVNNPADPRGLGIIR